MHKRVAKSDELPDFSMDGIRVKIQRHKKELLQVSCFHAIWGGILRQRGQGLELCGFSTDGRSGNAKRQNKESVGLCAIRRELGDVPMFQ